MAPLVSGPPVSSDLNWPNEMLYVFSRPTWQNGRFGHSAGPPRIESLPEHLLAKSDSDFRLYFWARAVVTAKAFWSAAEDALPKLSPTLPPRSLSAVTVLSTSPEATGLADLPLTLPLRNSVMVAAYSGTTWTSPFSRVGSYSSRLPIAVVETVYPAAVSTTF